MKKIYLLLITIIGITINCSAQKGFPNYYLYVKLATKADSLYKVKDFKNAAQQYLAAAKVPVEKGIGISTTNMYYNAACSYSRAHKTTEAFDCLNILVKDNNYSDEVSLTSDTDFDYIKKDKRWNIILQKIDSNKKAKERTSNKIKLRTVVNEEVDEIIFYPYTEFAKQFIDIDSLPFLSLNYLNYRVFFTAHSYASKHLNEVKTELSTTLNRALSILDSKKYNRGVNIIIVDSPEELEELTGLYVHGGFACIGHDLVFVVYNEKRRPQFIHEGFHLISNQVWGNTTSRLLNEGSAVYADNHCLYDDPIYSITSYIVKNNKAMSIEALINDFDNVARENEVIAYIQSASIFKYLYEQYGVDKMKQLWLNSFEQFESIYGFTIHNLEKEWSSYINNIHIHENIDWEFLSENGCG